jgi:acyl-CoA hydrolase
MVKAFHLFAPSNFISFQSRKEQKHRTNNVNKTKCFFFFVQLDEEEKKKSKQRTRKYTKEEYYCFYLFRLCLDLGGMKMNRLKLKQ